MAKAKLRTITVGGEKYKWSGYNGNYRIWKNKVLIIEHERISGFKFLPVSPKMVAAIISYIGKEVPIRYRFGFSEFPYSGISEEPHPITKEYTRRALNTQKHWDLIKTQTNSLDQDSYLYVVPYDE